MILPVSFEATSFLLTSCDLPESALAYFDRTESTKAVICFSYQHTSFVFRAIHLLCTVILKLTILNASDRVIKSSMSVFYLGHTKPKAHMYQMR